MAATESFVRLELLAALNVVLAREGWEAFYDEHDVGQLRHVATNTITQMATLTDR